VVVTRYINEHRSSSRREAARIQNATGFFVNPHTPPYFSWSSTQTWVLIEGNSVRATGGIAEWRKGNRLEAAGRSRDGVRRYQRERSSPAV